MNLLLALIQLLLILLIVLVEYKNGSVVIFLWATLLVMFGFPHFIAVITNTLIYSQEVYLKASFFVVLFNLVYIMFRLYFIKIFNNKKTINIIKNQLKNKNDLLKQNIESNVFFIIVILFFSISISLLIKNYGSVFNTSWGLLYSNSKNLYSIGLNFGSLSYFTKYILFAAGGLIAYFLYTFKLFKLSIISFLVILYSVITRNRIMILPFLVIVIGIFLIKYRTLNFKRIFLFSIVAVGTLYFVYALRLYRHYGTLDNFINTFNFFNFHNRLFAMFLNSDGELGLRNIFLYFIDKNNDFPNFNEGHTYLRMLMVFIPTKFSFGLKPPDFALSMGSAWINNFYNNSFSTHPTLYGDVFANFNWFGIIFGTFWAGFASFIDKLINKSNILEKLNYISVFGSMYVIIARGSVYNGFFIGVVSFLIYKLFHLFIYFIKKIRISF